MASLTKQPVWQDWIGMGASLVCLIHCVLFPVIMGTSLVLPLNDWWEWVPVMLAFLVGPIAIFTGKRSGRPWYVVPLFLLGLMALLINVLEFVVGAELLFKSIAAISLTTAHIVNRKYAQACIHPIHSTHDSTQ